MRRIIDQPSQSTVMFAFSHGTSAPNVMAGLEHPEEMVVAAREGGADCVFLAPGLIEALATTLASTPKLAVVAKVSATASRGADPHQERLISSVDYSASLGVDGVVAMIPFAPGNEPDVISLMAQLGEQCARQGIPLIAEAEFPNSYSGKGNYEEEWGLPYLKRSARLCAELGADIVKSNWPGSRDALAELVEAVPVPVVVAGGSKISDLALLERLKEARTAGVIGCSVGRNIFQHESPSRITAAITSVIRGELEPDEAMRRHLSAMAVK
jgi:fructose-bisphosphate aldolase/2-amino-3,7-dideoxy-D-threo-hept-6-ulosonate synthase